MLKLPQPCGIGGFLCNSSAASSADLDWLSDNLPALNSADSKASQADLLR
jgi:hypothetical protein